MQRFIVGLAVVAIVAILGTVLWMRDRPYTAPGRLVLEIREAIETEQWSRAEELIDQLDGARPGDSASTLLRAELERDRGRVEAALEILARIPDSDPRAAYARFFAGQIERDSDRLRPAESAFLAALELDPRLIQAHRELIAIYGLQARRDALNDQFRALAELIPLNVQDMMVWTVSHENIWASTMNQANLERFLAADPDDRWSRLALAEVLLWSGHLDESEAVLEPLPDSDVEARALRARLALDRGDLDTARVWLADGPREHADLARLRAQLALRAQDAATAVEQFRIAIRRRPTDREALQGLARALTLLGRDDEAAEPLRRAGHLRDLAGLLDRARGRAGREDPTLPMKIGAACEALGLRDEARGWYQIVIGNDPLNAEAQHALFRLRDARAGAAG